MSRPRRAPSLALTTAIVVLAVGLSGCDDPAATSPSPSATPERTIAAPSLSDETVGPPGELVEGFPTAAIGLPADAEVTASTAQPLPSGAIRFSLTYRTSSPPTDVIALYRDALAAREFLELAITPVDGLAGQAKFAKAATSEIVDVAVTGAEEPWSVTVGGSVLP